MRRAQKEAILSLLGEYGTAHGELEKYLAEKNSALCAELLSVCQDGALKVGEQIERAEGEGTKTVQLLEDYCEALYRLYLLLPELSAEGGTDSPGYSEVLRMPELSAERGADAAGEAEALSLCRELSERMEAIQRSAREELPEILEIAFLPYKASMWDSMESVYLAAERDPECHAVVVPIPYYDRNPDFSLGKRHYELSEFPPEIPCISCEDYDLRRERPDIVYIHNPYDGANWVTTVDPRFYSKELKKHAERLVYIPYYATSGGMGSGQADLPAYYSADDIVAQSESHLPYFSPSIPRERFVVTGSPKFDRVQRLCREAAEPPEAWRERISGKTVYFYNTSLSGMLASTEDFLKKLQYVFDCFRERKDSCLIWRPHPLMEATFLSLRKELFERYQALKQDFLREGWGIYDETADIEKTIALSDAYIGDDGTSVTALFGIAGKPLFILNDNIHSLPEEGDERGSLLPGRKEDLDGDFIVTEGNQLFARGEAGEYRFICRLSESSMRSYGRVVAAKGRLYICPLTEQEILVREGDGQLRSIRLRQQPVHASFFADALLLGEYLFLLPMHYPSLVRLDLRTEEVCYLEDMKGFFYKEQDGEVLTGGSCAYRNYLLLASPVQNRILAVERDTLETQLLAPENAEERGYLWMGAEPDGEGIWLLPSQGMDVLRWNPVNGESRRYEALPKELSCTDLIHRQEVSRRPFSSLAFTKKGILLAPFYADRFLLLDPESGEFRTWEPFFTMPETQKNGYIPCPFRGLLFRPAPERGKDGNSAIRYFSMPDRRLYELSDALDSCRELPLSFSAEELRAQSYGFSCCSPWLRYGCYEDFLHTLPDFLSGRLPGKAFDREEGIRAYREIAANGDGSCGEKTHEAVKERLRRQEKG